VERVGGMTKTVHAAGLTPSQRKGDNDALSSKIKVSICLARFLSFLSVWLEEFAGGSSKFLATLIFGEKTLRSVSVSIVL